MRVTCPSCQTAYNIDERRIPPGGAKLKCSKCQTLIPLRPPEVAVPPPSVAGVRLSEGAVPLPGLGLSPPPPASSAALPRLTPRAPEPPLPQESLTTGAIPLPPSRAHTPSGIPSAAVAPAPPPLRRSDRTMVAPAPSAPVQLPAPATPSRAVAPVAPAMPSRSVAPIAPIAPPPLAVPPDAPLPGFGEATFDDAGPAAPAESEDWSLDDPSYGAEPLHDTPADPEEPVTPLDTPAESADAAASWDGAPGVELGSVDLGGDDANATALPIPADEPSPGGGGGGGGGGEVAWTEPSPAPDMLDLSNLPQSHALDELDAGPAGDPLEFDPTRPSQEDLEADLSKPLPAGVQKAEDGLEVLGFLDEAAKEIRPRSGRTTRYHVRRRSGKVFGPFEPGVIVKMLEDGQLLGSEEVSTDGEAWTGLAAVPTFGQAMQRLVATPSPPAIAPSRPVTAAPASERPKLDLDQLAQAYGGRMAVVSVVDGEAQARFRKKLLIIGAGVLAVLALIGAGASLSATRYGAFGLRWIFPAQVSSATTDGKALADARAGMAQDTWPGLHKARAQLEMLLSRREYPEVRALWVQTVFFEQRRWGTADAAQVSTAAAALEDLKALPRTNPERIKAEAGQALAAKSPEAALALLRSAKLDGEGPLLEAEALVQRGQVAEAAQLLESAVKAAPSGAGWHALGLAHLRLKKPDKAQADFESALKVAPEHLSSSVELAQLAYGRKEPQAILTALEPALSDPKALAPPERSRGLALRGAALLMLGKPADAVAGLEEAVKADPTSIFAKGTLARAYAATKQDEKALPLWKAAVAGEPSNPVWAAGQVQSLAALKKSEEMMTAATKARAAFPKDEPTALVVARAQELVDRMTDAEQSYRAATQLDPSDLDAALGLAHLYIRQHRPADAKTALAVVTEKMPQDARLHVGLGDLAMANNDLSTAQSEFERATTLAPEMPEAWVARARVDLERRSWKDARAHAEKALSLDPEVADGHLVHGMALWKLGELDEAQKELEAARSAGPNSKLEVALAAVHFEKGDLDGAMTLLTAVLKSEPGNPEANFWKARVLEKKSEWNSALEAIRAAIERVPTRPAYHHELGRILQGSGKIPDAVEAWKQAVKLDPGYADAWEAMGQAYLDVNRYKDSIAAFEAALKADPSRTRILGSIGDAHFQAGKWAQAANSYQAALKADPSLTALYYRLGRASTEMGQHDKAIGFYQHALTITPDNAQVWYHLGYAWKERGRKKEAVNAFQNYLAKAPDAKDRKDIENEIYDLSR